MNTTTRAAIISATISRMIVSKVNAGMQIDQAVDAVLGAGTYKRIAGEVYHALRAKAQQPTDDQRRARQVAECAIARAKTASAA